MIPIGKGRAITFETAFLGEATGITDPLGLITRIDRDVNGNPTWLSLPSGHVETRTYNNQGNLLASTDETVGGTYYFAYEPIHNQTISATDPFGQVEQLEYDALGNLTQISTPNGLHGYVRLRRGLSHREVKIYTALPKHSVTIPAAI